MLSNDDYVEIQRVDALFAHVMDRQMWDRLGDVWTEDGGYDSRASGRGEKIGMQALREYFSTSYQPLIHVFTNHHVEGVEDGGKTALIRSRWVAIWHDNTVSSGDCQDIWKKTPKGWRLHRRATQQLTKLKAPPPPG